MGEVRCFYGWNLQKAGQLTPWVASDPQRYLLFVEENHPVPILQMPHPRIRCCSPDTFEQMAWEFLFLPFKYEKHPRLDQLAAIQAEVELRALDFDEYGLKLLRNMKSHLIGGAKLVSGLENGLKGLPAIVCGAGPSLSPKIAQFKERAVLIGCGAGVEALLKMNIRPHFAAHVDADPLHRFTPTDLPLLKLLRTSCKTSEQYRGTHILASGSGNFSLESWIQEKLGLSSCFDGGWTAGTFGVAMACYFGCNPIVLAGIDLCADRSKIYAPGVKTSVSVDQFIPVKNRQGASKVSRTDWLLAAKWLKTFAKSHSHIRFGTVAQEGLDIPGMPFCCLQDLQGFPGIPELVRKALEQLPKCEGKDLWEKIKASSEQCKKLCESLLNEIEKIFPRPPSESGMCALLEHDLTQELAYQQIFEPVWNYWKYPIQRLTREGEPGLFLNQILLLQSLCESIHAL